MPRHRLIHFYRLHIFRKQGHEFVKLWGKESKMRLTHFTSASFLYLLKTSENQRFSNIFRGYRNGALAWNRLIRACQNFVLNEYETLRDLIPFVQFKKRDKHPWRSFAFSKVAGWAYNFMKSNTPPWVFFTFFKLYKWHQIVLSIKMVHFGCQQNFVKSVWCQVKFDLLHVNHFVCTISPKY